MVFVGFLCLSSVLERLRLAFVARMGETRGVNRVLMGKPEGKGPLGRPSRTMVLISA